MPDIFLSYSRDDDATARRFAQELARAGFSVWWDRSLHSGEAYDEVTEQALREAKAVVVLWSRKSVHSRWVRSEATIAYRNGTLLPVTIELCDRPVMFELTQTADLTHWKGNPEDEAWCAFLDDVRRFVGRNGPGVPAAPAASPRTPSPAVGWGLAALLLVLAAGAWWLRGSRDESAASIAGQPLSIAVLPFVDMTPAGDDTPLAEGLAEEISNWLAQIPDLRVVARTSAFMFRGANQDVRNVGRQLGATHILEGSIRRGGNMVRVTVQLVAAADGYHLWSKSYNLPDGNALRIEDSVSRSVAESLNSRLSEDTERRWRARQANAPEAYGMYMQGRTEQRERSAANNLRAIESFRSAITQDPQFALAYVGLAEALINSVALNGRDLTSVAPEVVQRLDQALALIPEMPEAIAAQGWLALEQYRNDDALALMQRAVLLNPNDADTQRRLGDLHERLAQPRQALEYYDRSELLNPYDFMTHVNRCLQLQDMARFAEAEAACARARELNAANVWGPMATSWLAFGRGDLSAARQWIERAAELAPEDIGVRQQQIEVLLVMRRHDEARAVTAGLPPSAEPARSFLNAWIAVEGEDWPALQGLVESIARRSGLVADDWLELARLQLAAGAPAAAKSALDRALGSGDYPPTRLVDPVFVRHGFSAAVIVAGVELGVGNREAALRALTPLDEMLDRMESNGADCSGLHSLRAESLALRGEAEPAMAALRRAHAQGWRKSQSARREPYLRSLQQREDFRALMTQIDQQVLAGSMAP